MKQNRRSIFTIASIILLVFLSILSMAPSLTAATQPATDTGSPAPYRADFDELLAQAQADGNVPLIIGLKLPAYSVEKMAEGGEEAAQLEAAIAREQKNLLDRLAVYTVTNVKTYEYIPFMALTVDAAGLDAVYGDPQVTSIEEDRLEAPVLDDTIPLIRAHFAQTLFYDGSGQTVAILDTGVDKNHNELSGRVVSEACYSSTNTQGSTSLCPGGASSSTASNSGLNCNTNISGCDHGTHVAGIAAGVASDADLIAIQVFSRFDDSPGNTACANAGRTSPCTLSFTSDQILALNRVFDLSDTFDIAAVNMSLGGGQFSSNCDDSQGARKTIIDSLRAVKIATVIAAGNSGFRNALGAPACISTAISVGATDKNDNVASYSNAANFMTLWATGSNIAAPVPNNLSDDKNGTSMAAPHVAGAVAILKEAFPTLTVFQAETLLTGNGPSITDQRTGGSVSKPRLDVYGALCDIITCDSDDYRYLTLNFNMPGAISPGSDRDHYFYNGSAGEQVVIEMNRTSGSLNPYLELRDPNGNRVALNDNGGAGNNARINGYTLQQNGRYQVIAGRGSGFTGNYNLKISHNVVSLNPVPHISSIYPSYATGTQFGSSFWMRIYGQNFIPESQALLNGSYRPTYYSHSGLIWMWVYGSDLRFPWPNTKAVHVRNPSPGGGFSNHRFFNVTFPFLGTSELVAPEANTSISTGISTTFAISWTHPISSWRVMQNMDLILRDEDNTTAAWVRLTEGQPDSIMKLLNPADDGTPIGEGIPGDNTDIVYTDTVTLHLDESSFFGSGRTVIMSPTVTFHDNAVGTYNIEFRVDNEEGEVQADDVLGILTITPGGCTTSLATLDLTGPVTGTVDTSYTYTATVAPVTATLPISYTWTPEPTSGQGTAVAAYNWSSAGEKVVFASAENCGSFAAALQVTDVATGNPPDLSISKYAPAVALAGEPITYTLSISNSGAMTATNATVIDTLPEGANYVSGGSYVGGSVTWNYPALAGYGTVTQTQVVVTVTGTITNSSYGVSADGGYSANGTDDATTRIVDALVTVSSTTSDTLAYGSGQATTSIDVPIGAVFAETMLAYEELDSPTHPLSAEYAGRAFQLDGYQQNKRVSDFSFGEAVTITLTHADSNVAGLNENGLALLYWNGSSWSDDGVSCTVDEAANAITCTLDSAPATEYALAASGHKIYVPLVQNKYSSQDQAEITDVGISGDNYSVSFITIGFTPQLPGQHVHFFFDTVPPEEAGVPGSGPWYVYGGSSPFTGAAVSDKPAGATQMCVLVANPDHSVQLNTGNCYPLP